MTYKKNENGNTMIEVLGYLAIFGVLTAIVYAGYSAANRRIKVDRTVNTVNDVIQDIRTGFGSKRFYSILTKAGETEGGLSFADALIQNDVISAKLCVNWDDKCTGASCKCGDRGLAGMADEARLTHPLGGPMYITLDTEVDALPGSYRKFKVTLDGITRQTCFPIASQNWNGTGETVNVIESLSIDGKGKSEVKDGNTVKMVENDTGFVKFPLNLSDVNDFCSAKTEDGLHTITFLVR